MKEAEAARANDPRVSAIAFRHGDRGVIFLARQGLRVDAKATVAALRDLGLSVMILSGDNAEAVATSAVALEISEWWASMKPDEKIAFLETLKVQGSKTLMVGDGMNDAPALAVAHVSLSPISGAEIAQASADAVFLGERLAPVIDAIRISRKASAIMRQNLAIAVIYNLVPCRERGTVRGRSRSFSGRAVWQLWPRRASWFSRGTGPARSRPPRR